jgi:hypothetical protein
MQFTLYTKAKGDTFNKTTIIPTLPHNLDKSIDGSLAHKNVKIDFGKGHCIGVD